MPIAGLILLFVCGYASGMMFGVFPGPDGLGLISALNRTAFGAAFLVLALLAAAAPSIQALMAPRRPAGGTMGDEPIDQTKPRWVPDRQTFLAFAIVGLMFTVILVLLLKDFKDLNEKVYGALLTLLGVIAACFKDVYGFDFSSLRDKGKIDEAMTRAALAPTPPTEPSKPPTPDALAESTLTNGAKAYFNSIPAAETDAKKNFLGMSNTERAEIIAKTPTYQPAGG